MEKTIESILPVVLVFVFWGLYFSWDILAQRDEKYKILKRIVCILVLCYLVYIFLKITLLGRECAFPRRAWIIPFYSYYKYLSGWQVYLFKQSIQNILLFIPLGYFGSILLGREVPWKCRTTIVGIGLLLSLSVEVTQYVKAIGLFELDDIIHNTFGTFWGCLLYEMICCLRIIKTQEGRHRIGFNNRPQFVKNMKIVGIIIAMYLLVTLVAYANHLYHVHVLWR